MLTAERLVGLAVALLLLAGCSPGPQVTEVGTTAPEAPTVAAGRPLEFRWHQDSDGNEVPDFLERDLGFDPVADDCAIAAGCAQPQEQVVVVLDASEPLAGDDVRDALERYALGALPHRGLGLVVAGDGGREGACEAAEVRAPPGALTADSASSALPALRPGRAAPLEAGLRRAAELGPSRVVLVARGGDGCGGDPGAAALALRDAGAVVDVVGLGLTEGPARTALQELAAAAGGTYTDLSRSADLVTWATGELFAVHARLLDGAACAAASEGGGGPCDQDLADAAVVAIEAERAASGDAPDRQAELAALNDRVEAHALGSARSRQVGSGRPEDLRAQAEEIERRYRERFGPPPALVAPALARTPCRFSLPA